MAARIKTEIFSNVKCRPETVLPAAVFLLNAFFGSYVELIGCVSTVLLGAAVLFALQRAERPVVYNTLWAAGIAVLCFSYLFTVLYAVDRGLALLGFFKFLPLALFAFLCMQYSAAERQLLLHAVPAVGLLQLPFAALSYAFPALKTYFFTYGRFHGGFGYSNVYALFALCGMVILLLSPYAVGVLPRIVPALLLLGGLLLSGSRTVFLLAVPAMVFVLIREKRLRLPLGVSAAAVIAAAAVYGAVSGNIGNVARFLNFSISESSYIDRLLYYYDALPLILHHPFGLGYKGYTFIVPSVQTGLYSVTYVHNDYLQLMLDVGVLPALLFLLGAFKTLFDKVPALNKALVVIVALHCAVDFDLQFLSVLLLFPLLAAYPEKSVIRQKRRGRKSRLKQAVCAAAVCCILCGGYLSAATGLEAAGRYSAAFRLYPGLTVSEISLMRQAAEAEDEASLAAAEAYARDLIKKNKYIAVSYDVAAQAELRAGNDAAALELKEESIRCAPYTQREYLDLFSVLYQAIRHADAQNDLPRLREYCEELVALPARIGAALDRMSPLGKRITDQPDLSLPAEYKEYINSVKAALGE